MKAGLLLAAAVLATAAPTMGAVVTGHFEGVIAQGEARGNYGFDQADLAGRHITGTVRWDTARLGPLCPAAGTFGGAVFFGCWVSTTGAVKITHTINGHTETFSGDPSPVSGLPFNTARSGVTLSNLTTPTFNAAAASSIGDPGTVFADRRTGLAVGLDPGSVVDAGNNVLSYAGGVSGPPSGYSVEGLDFHINETSIVQFTGGAQTMATTYRFGLTSLSLSVQAAVPEPGTWALTIGGFAGVGLGVRRRRSLARA